MRTRWVWTNDISGPGGCGGMTYPHSSTYNWSGYFISSTSIWSGYVIPQHISGSDISFLHIHISGPDMSFLHISGPDGCRGMTYSDQIHVEESHIQTRWVWKNDRSRSDGCGGMTYQDQVGVEECHIRTRWMWMNDIFGRDVPHPSGPDMSYLHIHLVWICHSSICTWSGYVIPPPSPVPDMSFMHMHLVRICEK
jgi:hypothetical protein